MVGLENGGLYRVFEGVFENDVGRFCFTVFRPIQEGNGTKGSLFSNAEQDRLLPAGQRVSGPEVKMARRRYQEGSIRRRGNQWTLRWREDVVLANGTTKREQRTTLLGTVGQFPTKRLAEREATSFLARVNRLDYRPVKRATFAEFAESWKNQVIDLLKPSTAKVMASHLRFHLVPAFGLMRLDEIGQE